MRPAIRVRRLHSRAGPSRGRRPGPPRGRTLGTDRFGAECLLKLVARADVELDKYLAQVVLDRARADEEPGADLRVRESITPHLCDLRLLGGQPRGGPRRTGSNGLAGGEQLPAGPLCERSGSHRGEHLVCGPALFARVDPALLTAQPLSVEQMRPGQIQRDPAATEPLDRLPVMLLGGLAVAHER